ncbi:vegetative incompatibility het-E-1 [Fusarium tjaetaba]|uniref:Vegetative incompatibility het-E-1 n=1 Tax=Fusarium tjaetaba TaxID=1567544 RepID=A0A8H5V872_9HYPO|nr:vegetative incompatibility het-E-1 [Fusarium tjaetaba]KAF5614116.1 vegetative incompatibility het-E-1 [Fusarium tjaetaba]
MSPTILTGDNYGVQVANNYGVTEAHFHAERDDQRECFRSLRQTDPRSDKKRIEETRGGLYSASCAWILEQSDFVRWRHDAERRMLWIKGDPGKGKTKLLCSVIDEQEKDAEKGQRPCNFFCQATDARLSTATSVLRGLLYLLAEQDPSLLDKYILERYKRAGSILFTEKNAWTTLSTLFTEMMSDSRLDGKVFIIDGLDECEVDRATLLRFIVNAARWTRTKWLISSRNRSNIESELGKIGPEVGLSLELTENAERIADANNEALLILIRDTVRRRAQGAFLRAALVIEELQDAQPWDVEEILDNRPKKLYDRMFEQIQGLPKGNPENCRKVLASLLVAYQPLQLAELRVFSSLPPKVLAEDYIRRLVGQCASSLTIRDHIIYFVHQSAKEFLLGKKPYMKDRHHSTSFSSRVQWTYSARRFDATSTASDTQVYLLKPSILPSLTHWLMRGIPASSGGTT